LFAAHCNYYKSTRYGVPGDHEDDMDNEILSIRCKTDE